LIELLYNARDILVLVALFGLTIFIHELGHFLAAIWSGMVVEVFSIGFGPAIWKKKVNGIVLKIGCIPFGGYVSIPQLDPTAMAAVQGEGENEEGRVLPEISFWKKILVSLAGVTGNVILASILAWVVYLSPSVITEEGNTIIGSVDQGTPAYVAGVRPGDEILSVNGERVRTWYEYIVLCVFAGKQGAEVSLEIASGEDTLNIEVPTIKGPNGYPRVEGLQKSSLCAVAVIMDGSAAAIAGLETNDVIRTIDGVSVRNSQHLIDLVSPLADKTVPIVIERAGDRMEMQVTPKYDEERDRALIGITFSGIQSMPWTQYKRPGMQLKHDVWHIVRMLKALVTPKESGAAAGGLGGPPMILMTLWFTIKSGLINAIAFIRFLNINLAILNLLPIPVLDGGHLVFAAWEGLSGRKVHPKVVNALVNVFAVLLIGAMLFLSVRDFVKMPNLLRLRKAAVEQAEGKTEQPVAVDTKNNEDD
jgi:regulator of sigma E protease